MLSASLRVGMTSVSSSFILPCVPALVCFSIPITKSSRRNYFPFNQSDALDRLLLAGSLPLPMGRSFSRLWLTSPCRYLAATLYKWLVLNAHTDHHIPCPAQENLKYLINRFGGAKPVS